MLVVADSQYSLLYRCVSACKVVPVQTLGSSNSHPAQAGQNPLLGAAWRGRRLARKPYLPKPASLVSPHLSSLYVILAPSGPQHQGETGPAERQAASLIRWPHAQLGRVSGAIAALGALVVTSVALRLLKAASAEGCRMHIDLLLSIS